MAEKSAEILEKQNDIYDIEISRRELKKEADRLQEELKKMNSN